MKNDAQRINELTVALRNAEQKLAEREALVTAASGQTEAARSKYEHANERVETLRRQLSTLQSQLEAASAELTASRGAITARDQRIASLQQELDRRDENIATLKQLCAEDDNALNAINQDIKRQNSASPTEQLVALGFVLESMDEPGKRHRLGRVTTTLGRAATNDIAINSASVSRFHARIVVESDKAYLIDLQSTNGCSVNGQRVSRQIVTESDVIKVGDTKFKLAVGVPLSEMEDRSMDETHTLLDDAEIFSVVPRAR